jgi:cytochrome c1
LGVNNMVYENVGMPNVLFNMQGEQRSVCREVPSKASNGGLKQDPLTGKILSIEKCGFLEIVAGTGEVTKEEFDESMRDLANFMAYMTDPAKVERETVGFYVILYLIMFTILAFMLYREFKKDLH